MRRRKIELKYKKERVVFSDVLPYETPLIFTNRYFYRFALRYKVSTKDGKISWDKDMPDGAFESLKLLFGITAIKSTGSFNLDRRTIKIPFSYKIAHKIDKFRTLAIIHPLNQLQMVEFYEKYKSLILHYCSISNFSIRRPVKIACFFYYKDRLHEQLLGKKIDSKEEYMNEYENLKSYFSYQKYSNIYKFYEDYRYQRAEKKYTKLLRFDIQDCFNSIYTHSIVWATLGGINQGKSAWINGRIKGTFGDDFDSLMQKMNFAETNGIIIGPEFSRIFAEIILQRIDKEVEMAMISKEIYLKRDYECYRYVDDYFLFYNEENIKVKFLEQFIVSLQEYKLTIGDSKTKIFEKPFITDVTRAKQKIDDLLNKSLKIKIQSNEFVEEINQEKDIANTQKTEYTNFNIKILNRYLDEKMTFFISPTELNAKYKTIIKESNVDYKNIINYTLAKIHSRLESLLKKFDIRFRYFSYFTTYPQSLSPNESKKCSRLKNFYERAITTFLVNVLDVTFFLYSNCKRINTTLKVLAILNVIILYIKNDYQVKSKKFIRFANANKEIVFKKIQDEISLIVQTTPFNKNTQLEAFYLLLALKEMGNEFGIAEEHIKRHLKIKEGSHAEHYTYWNSLLIYVLLHYYSENPEYTNSLTFLKQVIKAKIDQADKEIIGDLTELTLLKMDIMTCPYLDDDYKKNILKSFQITDCAQQEMILKYANIQRAWFVKWTEFNLNYEVNAKVSQEVYS